MAGETVENNLQGMDALDVEGWNAVFAYHHTTDGTIADGTSGRRG
ncbi:hypothetical protein [Humibacter ginsenosidimutans]|nr:hypothetical protein [Humibacter ginsenosidimutans]